MKLNGLMTSFLCVGLVCISSNIATRAAYNQNCKPLVIDFSALHHPSTAILQFYSCPSNNFGNPSSEWLAETLKDYYLDEPKVVLSVSAGTTVNLGSQNQPTATAIKNGLSLKCNTNKCWVISEHPKCKFVNISYDSNRYSNKDDVSVDYTNCVGMKTTGDVAPNGSVFFVQPGTNVTIGAKWTNAVYLKKWIGNGLNIKCGIMNGQKDFSCVPDD